MRSRKRRVAKDPNHSLAKWEKSENEETQNCFKNLLSNLKNPNERKRKRKGTDYFSSSRYCSLLNLQRRIYCKRALIANSLDGIA
jgi:hypothetical protein